MPTLKEIDDEDATSAEGLRALRIDSVDEEGDGEASDTGYGEEGVEEGGEEEEEVDDEEDEEEDEEPVLLGFLEKPKNPEFLLRHFFPSKAGGVPAWLDPVSLPSEQSRKCGFCGEPLQFLLQVYAPLFENETTFHRTLYVFMCPSMACLLRDQHEQWKRRADNPARSVKVFRCQLPRSNPFYSCDPPLKDGSDKPTGPGVPLCCWCGTWKGDKSCSSCRRARYCSEKHQILHWRSGHKIECRQSLLSDYKEENLPGKHESACMTMWPEYEIIIDDESGVDDKMAEEDGSHLMLAAKSDESSKALFDSFEMDIDKKSWASFQQRIANDPEQILRYCRDVRAKPLWPMAAGRPSKADLPKCPHCGGPLCYEFQILPQLLYFFDVKNEPDSLDWATVAVYTCMTSCEAGISYKEEFPWVQLYTSSANI